MKEQKRLTTIKRIRKNETNTTIAPVVAKEKVEQPIVAEVITNKAPEGNDATVELSDQNAVASADNQSNVIHVSMDESLKYLDKNYREQATSPDAKSSRLQKLVDFASDIKDPVGEIRQFKEDLLAFNFKNEKKDQTK